MGKLLMLSLFWTLVTALLFEPALLGQPPGAKSPLPEGEEGARRKGGKVRGYGLAG